MFALAYVIIPTSFFILQAVLDETLAPFRRGGPELFPPDQLAFDDVIDSLDKLHTATLEFDVSNGAIGIWGGAPSNAYDLEGTPYAHSFKSAAT